MQCSCSCDSCDTLTPGLMGREEVQKAQVLCSHCSRRNFAYQEVRSFSNHVLFCVSQRTFLDHLAISFPWLLWLRLRFALPASCPAGQLHISLLVQHPSADDANACKASLAECKYTKCFYIGVV